MTDTRQLREALIERILGGEGTASRSVRRSAFENAGLAEPLRTLVQKVAVQGITVTDGDVVAARTSGLSEDQIFEIVVCAAVGQSARQYSSALAVLNLALREK